MKKVEFLLHREIFDQEFTLGRFYMSGQHFGYTCEDADCHLEDFPERKVHGQSAIPRGRYRVTATFSSRFNRLMPLIEGVAGFSGIRIHGGNDAGDTEGCPLLGRIRTARGVANCTEPNARLLSVIQDTEAHGGECWITVR